MYCPLTGKPCNKPKNIHVSDFVDGQMSHMHICQECACQLEQITGGVAIEPPMPPEPEPEPPHPFTLGLPVVNPIPPSNSPIGFFMKLMQQMQDRHREEELMRVPCPICGHTLKDVAETGRIGCPHCYTFFKHQLSPLLQKVQEGASHHVGKHPKPKLDSSKIIQNSIDSLQKKMDLAVKEERYEDAALIRDQIAALRKKLEFGGNG